MQRKHQLDRSGSHSRVEQEFHSAAKNSEAHAETAHLVCAQFATQPPALAPGSRPQNIIIATEGEEVTSADPLPPPQDPALPPLPALPPVLPPAPEDASVLTASAPAPSTRSHPYPLSTKP